MNEQDRRDAIRRYADRHIIKLEDGCYYFWPDGQGSFNSYLLRLIADYLDEKNIVWEEQISEYFKKEKQA
jgi:hypothetical protein